MQPNQVEQQQQPNHAAVAVAVTGMEAKLHRAAKRGSIEAMRDIRDWMDQETAAGNNVLHLHVEKSPPLKIPGFTGKRRRDAMNDSEFIKTILNDDDGYWLLGKQNSNWDTPLHLAAKFGYSAAVEAFLERAQQVYQPADEVARLLRVTNKQMDTALHEAARAGQDQVVKLLVEAHPNCSTQPIQPNAARETPLYLAAESGSTPSVISILQASPASTLAFKGPCGRTPLHAAVQWGDSEMVENILSGGRLLIRIPDEAGLTPLHCAAGEVYKVPLLERLLREEEGSNDSAVYIQDAVGRTPLHIAMLRKNWQAIHKLINSRPDCIEIVDNERQNVVHYAAKWTHFFILGKLLSRYHDVVIKLINDKDVNGNTPFHLLVASVNTKAASRLTSGLRHLSRFARKNPSINLKAFNNENLTVGDILLTFNSVLRRENMLREYEAKVFRRGRRITAYEKDVDLEKARIHDTFGERNFGSIKKATQSRLVVAALLATISFTAGFTIPGGFDQNAGKNMGMAVLKSKTSFGVFLVSDAVAFICSMLAILCYFMLVSTDEKSIIRGLTFYGLALNTISLGALMIAFVAAVSAILPTSSWLVYSTYAISALFFYFYFHLVIHTYKAAKQGILFPARRHNQQLFH